MIKVLPVIEVRDSDVVRTYSNGATRKRPDGPWYGWTECRCWVLDTIPPRA